MGKILKSPTGRAVLIGVVLIVAANVTRFIYLDATADPDIERAAELQDTLSNSVSSLRSHIGAEDALPESAGWTPKTLPCGESILTDPKAAAHPTWAALGVDLTQPTRFQYRFTTTGDDFELLARADNDCDGIYQVHRLKGDKGWTGVGADKVRVDNPGE